MNKQEAIKVAIKWWRNMPLDKNLDLMATYSVYCHWSSIDDSNLLRIYLSEHPEVQITETPTLFEKCENLWQNLNAVMIILESGTMITSEQIEHCKQVLITNKPSSNDK